jgi:hypothetical protein
MSREPAEEEEVAAGRGSGDFFELAMTSIVTSAESGLPMETMITESILNFVE